MTRQWNSAIEQFISYANKHKKPPNPQRGNPWQHLDYLPIYLVLHKLTICNLQPTPENRQPTTDNTTKKSQF